MKGGCKMMWHKIWDERESSPIKAKQLPASGNNTPAQSLPLNATKRLPWNFIIRTLTSKIGCARRNRSRRRWKKCPNPNHGKGDKSLFSQWWNWINQNFYHPDNLFFSQSDQLAKIIHFLTFILFYCFISGMCFASIDRVVSIKNLYLNFFPSCHSSRQSGLTIHMKLS